VPGAKKRWNNSNDSLGSRDSSDDTYRSPAATTISLEMSAEQARKEESGFKKIWTRIVYGACLFVVFAGSVSSWKSTVLVKLSNDNFENDGDTTNRFLFSLQKRYVLVMCGCAF
jgi:hypothetical protein